MQRVSEEECGENARGSLGRGQGAFLHHEREHRELGALEQVAVEAPVLGGCVLPAELVRDEVLAVLLIADEIKVVICDFSQV